MIVCEKSESDRCRSKESNARGANQIIRLGVFQQGVLIDLSCYVQLVVLKKCERI